MSDNVSTIAARHLGNAGSYENSEKVRPELLVKVPRSLSREESKIKLPEGTNGVDIWNCYEFSCLKNNGFPVTSQLKVVYDSSSEFIVESKSLKLYLHSYNFVSLGETNEEALIESKILIEEHLSDLLEVDVKVGVLTDESPIATIFDPQIFDCEFYNLDTQKLSSTPHTEKKHDIEILKSKSQNKKHSLFKTDSMRSNCRVTHQPDWATAYIIMDGPEVDPESLLRYIVSLRREDHFHEEAAELLFSDLYKKFNPDTLEVLCLYTRRGGIDINPYRYINKSSLDEEFRDVEKRGMRNNRQ